MISLLIIACSGSSEKPDPSTDSAVADTADVTEQDQGTTIDTATAAELVGTLPDDILPPPSFVASNSDGQARDQSHLIGQPTVIWFYPAAGTYG